MAVNEDSRPFAALRENAADFKTSFQEDITSCLALLDTNISTLLCDPDSLLSSPSGALRLSAHMEFSKAKYEIFMNMKSHMDALENSWLDQIASMKSSFLEHVEIFLAGTKLEVKLPPPESGDRRRSSPAVSRIRKGRQDSPSTSSASSLYPTKLLLDTARHIPVLNSLLPGVPDKEEGSDDSEEGTAVATPLRQNGKPLKRVTINTSPTIREFLASSKIMDAEEDMDSEEEEKEQDFPVKRKERATRKSVLSTPTLKRTPVHGKGAAKTRNVEEDIEEQVVKKNERATRKSVVSTPVSSKKTPVKSSLRRGNLESTEQDSTESSSSEERVSTPLRRRNVVQNEKDSSENSNDSEENYGTPVTKPEAKATRRGVRSQLAVKTVPSPAPGRKNRTPRRKPVEEIDITDEVMETNDEESNEDLQTAAHQVTPKNVQFSVGFDVNEDLDIYSPVVSVNKSGSRRKTMLNRAVDNFEDVNLTPDLLRSRSKRKTIGGDTAVPSPKRLKKGGRGSIVPSKLTLELDEPMESNLLEGDVATETAHYSPWIPLGDISAKVPACPGVYELKVASAKKPAYIGGCENLRQKLTLHKLTHSSGHKHLDKYIERNIANILVRYEQLPSAVEAKTEEKNRVRSFVTEHKNTPAYN